MAEAVMTYRPHRRWFHRHYAVPRRGRMECQCGAVLLQNGMWLKAMTMPASKRRIRLGGLYRCCVATIEKTPDRTAKGDRLQCPNCKSWMQVDGEGAWSWVSPA